MKVKNYILTKGDAIISKIAVLIQDNPGLTIKEVAQQFGMSYKTSHRYLRKLRERGILYVKIEKDNMYRYYPNPAKREFLDSARSLLEKLNEIKLYVSSIEP